MTGQLSTNQVDPANILPLPFSSTSPLSSVRFLVIRFLIIRFVAVFLLVILFLVVLFPSMLVFPEPVFHTLVTVFFLISSLFNSVLIWRIRRASHGRSISPHLFLDPSEDAYCHGSLQFYFFLHHIFTAWCQVISINIRGWLALAKSSWRIPDSPLSIYNLPFSS